MQRCPRCQRANPDDALFCHFEGAELGAVAGVRRAANLLLQEFVFPSGRRCRTFEELVEGCQEEWDDARTLLHKGALGQFLAGIGRSDLARAAEEARRLPNPDAALHEFIGQLPARPGQGPGLELEPRRFVVGKVTMGTTRHLPLTVINAGTGHLRGSLAVSSGQPWLGLAGSEDPSLCRIDAVRRQQCTIAVETQGLRAGTSVSGKLTAITNGGIAEIPLRVELLAAPFPHAPFQGTTSRRELAERMRKQPKAAIPLLENGEVGRWFDLNGWPPPARGPVARGMAAVQQFFEALRLSKVPFVGLTEYEAHVQCDRGDVVYGEIILCTEERKYVYGFVQSNTDWLRVLTPDVNGPQHATIAYEVDASFLVPGLRYVGLLTVVANSGQELPFQVTVDVYD